MRAVGWFVRVTRKRRYAAEDGGARLLSAPKGPSEPVERAVRGLTVTHHEVAGRAVYEVSRPGLAAEAAPVVVYLHGGAFVSEIAPQHWALVAEIARTLDVVVQVPIYGLAPAHHAAEATALVATLLDRLYEAGRPAYLVGDSAGGNLALIGAQQAAARGVPVRGVTLMAPWLDLTMANPEIAALEPHDPWLARAALHEVARVWAGGVPLDDPAVSPLFGSCDGLPPVSLWIGTRDITLPDTRLLRERLPEVTYHELDGALHVFPLLPVPEGRAARPVLIEEVRRALVR